MRPVVLTIAGSDSSGGAGIQADVKSIEACGGWAATVITAVTAQGPHGVRHVHRVPERSVEAQLACVLDELPVAAVKTGMLANERTVRLVARELGRRAVRILVCDPVIAATSGAELLDAAGQRALARALLPLATLVTPNAAEAERLSGIAVRDLESAERAARAMRSRGARAVLVKGGHFEVDRAIDLLLDDAGAFVLRGEWIDSPAVHGTGCALAAAIATHLARGLDLREAAVRAKRFVAKSIRAGATPGAHRAVDPLFRLHPPDRR